MVLFANISPTPGVRPQRRTAAPGLCGWRRCSAGEGATRGSPCGGAAIDRSVLRVELGSAWFASPNYSKLEPEAICCEEIIVDEDTAKCCGLSV